MNTPGTDSKQVLIVDDDAQTCEGLAMAMEFAGHTVLTAGNGREALQELRSCQPDLILLDLVMPTMDGWAFRMHQMQDPTMADIPVVILSGSGASARGRAAQLGISTCFHKPSCGDGVLNLMGDLLDVLDQDGVA